jgi:hypothetical protein
MANLNRGVFSLRSNIVSSMGGSTSIKMANDKSQNFPGGGIGARSSVVRRVINARCEYTPNDHSRRVSAENVIAAAVPDYFTPAPFSSILNQPYSLPTNMETNTTVSSFNRYILKYTDGRYLTIDQNFGLVLTSGMGTYRDILTKIFEFVCDPSDNNITFRVDSDLDSLYSLDYNASSESLQFSNNWGQAALDATYGYVRFQYINKKLIAKGRQAISDQSYNRSNDSSFAALTDSYVYYDTISQLFKLTHDIGSSSSFILQKSPIHADMPADFNPYRIPYQPNSRVSIKAYAGVKNTIAKMDADVRRVGNRNLSGKYTSQVVVPGYDIRTTGPADTMLDSIFTTVGASNLRYEKSVYREFRAAALRTILSCNSIADGAKGQNTVPYVYYTMEKTVSDDVYHPFMVIASYSISDKPNRLTDVCRPPASEDTDYPHRPVTRDVTLQNYLTKIPMRNYGLVTSLTENVFTRTLFSDDRASIPPITVQTPYNYASVSAVGIAVDGVVIYPTSNNTLHPAQAQAEIANTGIHIGQGMGLHYHADGHSANSNNMNLYNTGDYVGRRHPPLIGFGLDGVALYGRYDSGFNGMHGFTTMLDQYGGHSHSDGKYGYHYHAHTARSSDLTGSGMALTAGMDRTGESLVPYNLHILMKGAWAGKINTIPSFWDGSEPSYTIGKNDSIFAGFAP